MSISCVRACVRAWSFFFSLFNFFFFPSSFTVESRVRARTIRLIRSFRLGLFNAIRLVCEALARRQIAAIPVPWRVRAKVCRGRTLLRITYTLRTCAFRGTTYACRASRLCRLTAVSFSSSPTCHLLFFWIFSHQICRLFPRSSCPRTAEKRDQKKGNKGKTRMTFLVTRSRNCIRGHLHIYVYTHIHTHTHMYKSFSRYSRQYAQSK